MSMLEFLRAIPKPWLPTHPCSDTNRGVGELLPEEAYSGRFAKLSGVTTTLYVPGTADLAFLSRSSSFVRVANAGRLSFEVDLDRDTAPGRARAGNLVSHTISHCHVIFQPHTIPNSTAGCQDVGMSAACC